MTVDSTEGNRFIAALVAFVERDLHAAGVDGEPLTADDYLFETGRIDSLKILQLIAFVERWTGTPIAEPDIVMANFRTIRTIADRFAGGATK